MIAKFKNHLKKAERGQSIILLAFAFVVLLGFVGLTTDVSLMFVRYATIRRAVDSASLAAATQMRQGTEEAAVAIAARQFVEFHGLDSVDVLVETCQTLDRASPDTDVQAKVEELCTADQRKLVKVTVQIESPTVFLRLLGWESFTLQASALSETAALDVVLIMDVSESMLTETTYDDWAKVGMGWAFAPPHVDGDIIPGESADPTDYWHNDLLAAGQNQINTRLWYNDPSGNAEFDGTTPPDGSGDKKPLYEVEVLRLEDNNALYDVSGYPSDVSSVVPRKQCTVRFSPISQLDDPDDRKGRTDRDTDPAGTEFVDLGVLYDELSADWNYPAFGDNWSGFVPTYDYYACCNDPGQHINGADGLPVYQDNGYATLSDGTADFNFTDLICQPFKGARDAVELFLEKIDFIRGDRVAFVTFDRSAFLINPWNEDGQIGGGSHMMDSYPIALDTLRRVVGVRAEPNFYVWNDTHDAGSGAFPSAQWEALAAGIGTDASGVTGSIPINYDSADGSGTSVLGTNFAATDRIDHNYPIFNNCFFADAANTAPYSLAEGTLGEISHPYPEVAGWGNHRVSNIPGASFFDDFNNPGLRYFIGKMGYEFYSECRGTNIGAALREGNNALLDPNTSRRFGAIWVMVLLSDGAAGASDPVRDDGRKLGTPNPYFVNAADEFDPIPGEYGTYGVCPYGIPGSPAELVDIEREMDTTGSPKFPFCSDEDPASRHDCDFRPARDEPDAMWDNDFVENPPGATTTEEILEWNQARGNLYDVDIGTQDCTYYDVDDYARDWADLIALRDPDAVTEELLPTIYTIGFGLTFGGDDDPDVTAISRVGDYLGEQMLRYIADAGDNNELDNDYYQNYAENGSNLQPTIPGGFDVRGPCQVPYTFIGTGYDENSSGGIDPAEADAMYGPRSPRENCGNYFNAPNADELEFVFDSIASKLFTRLTG